jgi:hypothetical protein
MSLDKYSSRRNVFPTADEIKRTTQPWKDEAVAKQVVAEKVQPFLTELTLS